MGVHTGIVEKAQELSLDTGILQCVASATSVLHELWMCLRV